MLLGGGDTPEITGQEAKPMSMIEILTFGILVIDLIRLVYELSRRR